MKLGKTHSKRDANPKKNLDRAVGCSELVRPVRSKSRVAGGMGGKVACRLLTAVYFDNCDFTLVRGYSETRNPQLQPLPVPERKHLSAAGDWSSNAGSEEEKTVRLSQTARLR
jgi:hypothetical protein